MSLTPYYEQDGITIYHGDCREILPQLGQRFDLALTSPPYNCGKDYGTWSDSLPWGEYWSFTREWVSACLEAASDNARLIVNLPWWMDKKPRRDVPQEFKTVADELGWNFIDKIIWVKGSAESPHAAGGVGWGTYLSPSGPSIRCASEPILVFSSGSRGRGRVSGEGRGRCVPGDITPGEWHEWTIDVWSILGASDSLHPAPFPREIPERVLKLYTWPGDVVLDPFSGTGTTLFVAKQLGRKAVGIELEERFCEIAVNRLRQKVFQFAEAQ